MDRLGGVSRTLLLAGAERLDNERQNTVEVEEDKSKIFSNGDSVHQSAPPIIEEIERLKIIRKKYQSLEDTERCMTEWKSKGSLDLGHLEQFVLGEIAQYSQKYLDFMKNDPDYALTEYDQKPKDEQRRLTNMLLFKVIKKFPISMKDYKDKPWDLTTLFLLSSLAHRSLSTKIAVHFFLYGKSIMTLGTDKHLRYLENALSLKDLGCFALTELSHGSNVQGCITNAVFDEKRKNFVIYTPHERGMKFWIGNAAHTANMAVIAANLIVKGIDYGIHLFLVEIRDRVTHNLIPGVTLGDCGDKMGLNGVDNGFIAFRGLRVPRDALLNRITDVDENGNVTSRFENKSQRFAVQLSALSDGRVKVGTVSCLVSLKCLTIALRFAAVRRQFGEGKYKELAILEYPSMQSRLFPLLALAIVPLFAARKINNIWYENYEKVLDPKNETAKEMHGLISVIKPLTTEWTLRAMEESRKAMGGLGYSIYAEVPRMINDVHIITTWEGDNNVLLQQVSKFILKGLSRLAKGKPLKYASLDYLGEEGIEDEKFNFETPAAYKDVQVLHRLLKIRAKRAAMEGTGALTTNMSKGLSTFCSWNRSIPFDLDCAAKAYGELYIYDIAKQQIASCSEPRNKSYLENLLCIYAIGRVKENYELLADNLDRDQVKLMNELLLNLFYAIKYDAVLSLDGLLMEDEIVRSPFGTQKGNMYEQFMSRILAERDNFGRAPYWRDIVMARNGSSFDLAK